MIKSFFSIIVTNIYLLSFIQAFNIWRPPYSEISFGWIFFKSIFLILVLLVPKMLFKTKKGNIHSSNTYFLLIMILLFEYIGTSYGIYRNTVWYDILAHTGAGIVSFYFLHILLSAYLKIKNIIIPMSFFYFVVLMSSCGVSVLNELLELFVDKVLLDPYKRIYPGYDTVEDLAFHVLGSIVCLLFLLFINRSISSQTKKSKAQ